MDGPVIQTVIGLVFIFAVFAGLVAMVTESVSRFIGLRGEYLLRGIRSLVDGTGDFELKWRTDLLRRSHVGPDDPDGPQPMVTRIMNHPMVASAGTPGINVADPGNAKLTRVERKALPSYVSGRSFASAVIGTIVPDADGTTTLTQITDQVNALQGQDELKTRLLFLISQAENDIGKFRRSLEQWYDDHMARVSGWYKRHVRWISLGLALIFAAFFNLNAIEIGRTLYSDEAVRAQVVEQAQGSTACKGDDDKACLEAIRKAENAGIPIGWATAEVCAVEGETCAWYEKASFVPVDADGLEAIWALLMLLFGIALMAAATIPGARFWFDSLSKLGSLRSTGPKPPSSTSG